MLHPKIRDSAGTKCGLGPQTCQLQVDLIFRIAQPAPDRCVPIPPLHPALLAQKSTDKGILLSNWPV